MHADDPEDALVPLFHRGSHSGGLQQVGTGILVDFQSEPFLFTAAHVTDKLNHGELLVPAGGDIVPIEGYVGYVDLPPEVPRRVDPIDVAYYRLSTVFAHQMLYHFRPFPHARCQIVVSATELGSCSIFGYPVSRAKKKGGKFTSESATYRGVAASEQVYERLGLDPKHNIIIHFHKSRAVSPVNQERINPISPRGVSGGGVFAWPYGHELSDNWTLPSLVGIFHTYKEREGLMIGTPLVTLFTAIQLGRMKGFGGVT